LPLRQGGRRAYVPIVFNLHYMGTMDYWDPAVTDVRHTSLFLDA
jgi:hypothetical protein